MFRYRLRTLLIVLTLGPPAIGLAWKHWPPPVRELPPTLSGRVKQQIVAAAAQERLGKLEDEIARPRALAVGLSLADAERRFAAACAECEPAH